MSWIKCNEEEYKMVMGRIKVFLLCWYLILVYTVAESAEFSTEQTATSSESNVSIACFGEPGLGCTDHKLICTEPLMISITNVTFGYRPGCSPVNETATCMGNISCCNETTDDCFTPYNQTLLSELQHACNGETTCTLNRTNGLDEISSLCNFTSGAIFHSYSKIEYNCVTNTTVSTEQTTTSLATDISTDEQTLSSAATSTDEQTTSSSAAVSTDGQTTTSSLATVSTTTTPPSATVSTTTTTTSSETKVSTACFGSRGVECVEHRFSCTDPLVISITNITFGYRRGCGGQGLSSCSNKTCCIEETGDCFTPYNQTLLSVLQQTCTSRSTCTLNSNNGLTEVSSHCNSKIRHSYSKIEYQCVTNTAATISTTITTSLATDISTTTTTSSSSGDFKTHGGKTDADDGGGTNVGGIVGGIVGVILVIAIVGAVIFFYKRRDQKTAQVSRNVPNQRYQSDSALPRNTTPHNSDIELDNTTCLPRTNPPSGDDYDYIAGDNHVKQADNYNHIGQKTVTSDINLNHTGEDNYHHIGENQSNTVIDDAYNHIGEHNNTGLDSGGYHHIGGNLGPQGITDVTYNHFGGSQGHPVIGDGTYNHIGDSHGHPVVADGTYNHIGDSHRHPVVADDTYNHIGHSHGHPVVADDTYNHIADSNGHPGVAVGTYNHIEGDHTGDKQEGDYSLAKHN